MAISKSDFLAYEQPEITPIYSYKAEIDTTPAGTNRTWKDLCAGFDNIAEALNESIQQYFFLCGNGFATNYVTGMAPAITLSGRRVIGDDAQDYVFGVKYGVMNARKTHFRLTQTAQDGTTNIISANVTLVNLSDISGATTDGSACSVEIRFNGEPYAGDAWAELVSVTQNLTACASSFTADKIAKGDSFTAYLTADQGKTLATPTITMGGTSVSDAWNADQGAITIASVTGAIVVTATAT